MSHIMFLMKWLWYNLIEGYLGIRRASDFLNPFRISMD